MRIKRGINSMRLRRRQSDAKWRASVASCYDTLKFVIPDSGKLSKRKISKAVILQETDKHINELEKAVANLLTHEASSLNKNILWRSGRQWNLANLGHIRKDFEAKQVQLFEQSTQGRRRYSMLADIEDDILHMAVDTSKMTVISCNVSTQTASVDQGKKTGKEISTGNRARISRKVTKPYTEPKAHSTPCAKKVRHFSNINTSTSNCDSQVTSPVECERIPDAKNFLSVFNPDCKHSLLQDAPITSLNTPSKMCYTSDSEKLFSPVDECEDFDTSVNCNSKSNRQDVKPPVTSLSLSKVAKQLKFLSEETSSPPRPVLTQERMKEMGSLFGFTPIKLPSTELDFSPLKLPLQMIDTPNMSSKQQTLRSQRTTYPPQTPKESCKGTDEETKSLLCFETFDMPGDGPDWERTPKQNTSSEDSKCKEKEELMGKCKRKIAFGAGSSSVRKNTEYVPKCRKNLEKLYASQSEATMEKAFPVITGVFDRDASCSDFDGYFLFYRQVVDELQQHMSREEIASPSVAALVSQMWSDMSSSEKDTLATLAALEGSQDSNSSSELSDDLQQLDVKPLDPSHFIHAERLGIMRNNFQTVPNADSRVAATVGRVLQTYDIQEVPVSWSKSQYNATNSSTLIVNAEDMAVDSLEIDNPESEFSRIQDDEDFCEAGTCQVFLVPKKDTDEFGMIIDLKNLNQEYLRDHPSIKDLKMSLKPSDWIISFGLQDCCRNLPM